MHNRLANTHHTHTHTHMHTQHTHTHTTHTHNTYTHTHTQTYTHFYRFLSFNPQCKPEVALSRKLLQDGHQPYHAFPLFHTKDSKQTFIWSPQNQIFNDSMTIFCGSHMLVETHLSSPQCTLHQLHQTFFTAIAETQSKIHSFQWKVS